MRAMGFRLRFSASSSGITTTAAPPSTIPLALPAVTEPFLPNAGFSFARLSIVVSGRRWSSSVNISPVGSPLRLRSGDRGYLFLQPSSLVGFVSKLLRAQRELVLHLARDAVLPGVKLGRVRHVQAAIAVEQRHHERILKLAFA